MPDYAQHAIAAERRYATAGDGDAPAGRSGTPTPVPVMVVLRRHLWRMLGAAGLMLAAGAAAYPVLPRSYEATALILLRPTDQEGRGDWDASARLPLDENGIQSEMDILSSPLLGAQVIGTLGLAADPEFNTSLPQPGVSLGGLLGTVTDGMQRLAAPALRSGAAERAAGNPDQQFQRIVERVQERLSVRRERRSYVLRIGYRSDSAEKSAAMANALVTAYLAAQVARKQAAQERLTGWYAERVAVLQGKLDRSTAALENFMLSSGLVDIGEQSSLQQQLSTLSTQVATARARTIDAQATARQIAELQRAGTLDSAPEAMRSVLIQNLKERIATLSANVGGVPGGPFSAPQSAINDLRQAVQAEAARFARAAQVEAVSAVQREEELRKEIARLNTNLTLRQQAEWQVDTLRREATADRAALEEATKRLQPHVGRNGVLQPDGEIVAAARPPVRPASPKTLLMLVGTLGMAIVAAGLAVLSPLRRRGLAAAEPALRPEPVTVPQPVTGFHEDLVARPPVRTRLVLGAAVAALVLLAVGAGLGQAFSPQGWSAQRWLPAPVAQLLTMAQARGGAMAGPLTPACLPGATAPDCAAARTR